jgi:hypothetical protein
MPDQQAVLDYAVSEGRPFDFSVEKNWWLFKPGIIFID